MSVKNILGKTIIGGLLFAGIYWSSKDLSEYHDNALEYRALIQQKIYLHGDTNKDGKTTQGEIEFFYTDLFQKHNSIHLDNDCVIYKSNGQRVPYDSLIQWVKSYKSDAK